MEEELVRRSQKGDEAAFAELFSLYRPKILQECLKVVREQSLAEDVTQECFIRAYNRLSSFEGRSSFYTWVWRIAHNLAIDMLKKERNFSEIDEEQLPGKTENSDESLQALVQLLPNKHQRVFHLFYIDKLSQKEIAEKLNLPYGTVRSRLYYARKKLKQFQSKVLGKTRNE